MLPSCSASRINVSSNSWSPADIHLAADLAVDRPLGIGHSALPGIATGLPIGDSAEVTGLGPPSFLGVQRSAK